MNEEKDGMNELPRKSKAIYEKEYSIFNSWCHEKCIKTVDENDLLAYYDEMSKTKKSSTLWVSYGMLRACLNVYKNLDISKFARLRGFLKRHSEGYQPKKSKTLDSSEVDRFIREANDVTFLAMKVILIMGYAGACRRDELMNMSIHDLEFKDEIIIVTVRKTITRSPRIFVVTKDDWIALIKMYVDLRPKSAMTKRFFLTFRNGRCIASPIGINTIGKVPKIIASFLKLPNPEEYTGRCFRRSSIFSAATEGYTEASLKKQIEEAQMLNTYIKESFPELEVRLLSEMNVNSQGNTNY